MDYISSTLCHFVGKALENDSDRYSLLKTIVQNGVLLCNPKDAEERPKIQTSSSYIANELGEVFEKIDCVCFCDIPDGSLSIHTNKYSKFGMGFSKSFLANQGTRPVTYVPVNYNIIERCADTVTPKTPRKYYQYLSKIDINLTQLIMWLNANVKLESIYQEIMQTMPDREKFEKFIDSEVLTMFLDGQTHSMLYSQFVANTTANAYIKLFDPTLPDNAANNYYMEREWRTLSNISFKLDDIKSVYFPSESYRDQFLSDFPKYKGNSIII